MTTVKFPHYGKCQLVNGKQAYILSYLTLSAGTRYHLGVKPSNNAEHEIIGWVNECEIEKVLTVYRKGKFVPLAS